MAPRFCTFHHQNSFDPSPKRDETFLEAGELEINDEIDLKVREELRRRGHPLRVIEGRAISNPSMIRIGDGRLEAAGDPRAGRHSAAV